MLLPEDDNNKWVVEYKLYLQDETGDIKGKVPLHFPFIWYILGGIFILMDFINLIALGGISVLSHKVSFLILTGTAITLLNSCMAAIAVKGLCFITPFSMDMDSCT